MKFLIWSNEHSAWWAPNKVGYTKVRAEAGRYELREAIRICAEANVTIHDSKPDETMCPDWGTEQPAFPAGRWT